jgi:serine/threonine-protein kinase
MLTRFRTKKAIQMVLSADETSSSAKAQAVNTLKQLGKAAVPSLIQALDQGGDTQPLISLLAAIVDTASLPLCCQALSSGNPVIMRGIVASLSEGKKFDPNQLLSYFADAKMPKTELVTILAAHKHKLAPKAILSLLDTVEKTARAAVFRLIDEVVQEAMMADVIPYAQHAEWLVRLHMTRVLSRFNTAVVRDALLNRLTDEHKEVRQAALEGLSRLDIAFDVGPICQLLRDPDLTVQSTAIETLARLNNPQAVHHLLDVLQDESEYVRRAAVEVLNAIGNTHAIKDLLGALRDKDWWVRVRAADALGNIGGPRVIEAIMPLMRDEDTFIRRCVIEILNTKNDTQTFDVLLEALEDPDWWVCERAIDALKNLGDGRAVPALTRLIQRDTDMAPTAIRAIAALGDETVIEVLLPKLHSSDKAAVKEALQALQAKTTAAYAGVVQASLSHMQDGTDEEICALASSTMHTLVARFGERTGTATVAYAGAPPCKGQGTPSAAEPAAPPLAGHLAGGSSSGSGETPEAPAASVPLQLIDATTLEPDTVIAERYRVIRSVGKGAFGIVILVEDMVVHEEIILKFLNPYLAANDGVIKRFIHELRYARKITHENVIRIYDFLTLGKSCAISMEYFPSHALAVEMASMGAGVQPRKFDILRDICKGMSVAHQANIVHRDLKPQNILINDDGLVKIVDFGLAAAITHPDSRLTGSGALMGTPTYMAPEQIRGGEIDPRTDIYSLGVIMYEMFTGRPPYVGQDPMSVLYQHIEGKAHPPRQLNPQIPAALEALIRRAMALEPGQRYATVEELRKDIEILYIPEQK